MTSVPAQAPHVPADLPAQLAQAITAGPLVRVVTGSHLHGFATPASDHDSWLVVHEPRDRTRTGAKKIWQSIERHTDEPDVDLTVVGLSTWLHYCAQGIPQALDVMFAHGVPVLTDAFPHLRAGFRANPYTATPSFHKMMNQIVTHRTDVPKQRRHAFRLAMNLRDVQTHGRYDPTLSDQQRELVLALAEDEAGFVDRLTRFSGLTFT